MTPNQHPPLVLQRRQLLGLMAIGASGLLTHLSAQANSTQCKIGFLKTYEPFSFLDENNQPIGFDIDVNKRLCEVLNLNMQVVAAGMGTLIHSLQNNDIDWIGNQLLTTPDNRQQFDFVKPAYANIQLSCIQHEDDARDYLSLDDLYGQRLGVLANSGIEQQTRDALGKSVIGFERIDHAFKALANKELDAVLEESLIADYYIELHHWPIKVTAPFAAPMPVGLPLKKGNDPARDKLGKAVQTILNDGSFKAISERWFGYDVSRHRASPAI